MLLITVFEMFIFKNVYVRIVFIGINKGNQLLLHNGFFTFILNFGKSELSMSPTLWFVTGAVVLSILEKKDHTFVYNDTLS